MIRQEWHIDDDELAAYASGRSGAVMLSSIEAHLITCASCRDALAGHVHPTRDVAGDAGVVDDPVWAAIAARVDRGPRALARSTRLLHVSISSPPLAMTTALLAALLVVFVCIARLGESRYATSMLVSLGPIAPLVGARIAFGRRIDPAGTMAAAAPLSAGRVASARALVVTLAACVAGILVSPLTTIGVSHVAVWLLPALALSAASAAIGTFVDSTVPTIALGMAWVGVVAAWLNDVPRAVRGLTVEGLATSHPSVQVALLLATLAAVGVVVARRDCDPNWRTL